MNLPHQCLHSAPGLSSTNASVFAKRLRLDTGQSCISFDPPRLQLQKLIRANFELADYFSQERFGDVLTAVWIRNEYFMAVFYHVLVFCGRERAIKPQCFEFSNKFISGEGDQTAHWLGNFAEILELRKGMSFLQGNEDIRFNNFS